MALYSHSRLSTFENCPRQYYYQYVAKIKPEEAGNPIEFFLGSLVHESLEKLYRDRLNGKVLTARQLVAHFNAAWKKQYHADEIVINHDEYSEDDYRRVGVECLEKYHTRHTPFDAEMTLDIEKKVIFKLDRDGHHRMQGYIDRLARRPDGTYEIHDYKTSNRLPAQQEADADRQLALYQIGVGQQWRDVKSVELVWHYLRFDTEIRSTRTREELKALATETRHLIDDIESRREEADFPTNKSGLCDWCAYQDICPVWKHLYKTQALPPNRFLKEPGVKLVGRYATLTAEIDELQQRQQELESQREEVVEALFTYAEKNDLEVIVGKEAQVGITHGTDILLPRKSQEPEEYAELDRKLRRSKVWPEVSVLDIHKLKRIAKGNEPGPGRVQKMIEPFVREEEKSKISLGWRDEDG